MSLRTYLEHLESEHTGAAARLEGIRQEQQAALAEEVPAEQLTGWHVAEREAATELAALAAAIARVREQVQEEATLTEGARVAALNGRASRAWQEAREAADAAGEVATKTLRELVLPAVERAEQSLTEAREASHEATVAGGRAYSGRRHWPTGLEALLPHLREYLQAGARDAAEVAAQRRMAAEHEARAQREAEAEASIREHLATPVEVRNQRELRRVGMR
jgi:hypothetical protein